MRSQAVAPKASRWSRLVRPIGLKASLAHLTTFCATWTGMALFTGADSVMGFIGLTFLSALPNIIARARPWKSPVELVPQEEIIAPSIQQPEVTRQLEHIERSPSIPHTINQAEQAKAIQLETIIAGLKEELEQKNTEIKDLNGQIISLSQLGEQYGAAVIKIEELKETLIKMQHMEELMRGEVDDLRTVAQKILQGANPDKPIFVRDLQSGAMGKTSLFYEIKPNPSASRFIVVKEMLIQNHQELTARFAREAAAMQRIDSQYVVKIYSFDPATSKLTMEFVRGITLQKRREEAGGQLPLLETFETALQILDGLEAIHEHAIHRDLKPENIMLLTDRAPTESKRVKIIDLGAARLKSTGQESLTMLTAPLTGNYAAPEQLEVRMIKKSTLLQEVPETEKLLNQIFFTADTSGENLLFFPEFKEHLDSVMGLSSAKKATLLKLFEEAKPPTITYHADLWALGTIIYEMLTGEIMFPYSSPSNDYLKVVGFLASNRRPFLLDCDIPNILDKRTDVPTLAQELLEKLLAKNPTERPSHTEVRRLLNKIIEAIPAQTVAIPIG